MKEYWVNLNDHNDIEKDLKDIEKDFKDINIDNLINFRKDDCIVLDKPNEKITIKYIKKDALYELYKQYKIKTDIEEYF